MRRYGGSDQHHTDVLEITFVHMLQSAKEAVKDIIHNLKFPAGYKKPENKRIVETLYIAADEDKKRKQVLCYEVLGKVSFQFSECKFTLSKYRKTLTNK